MNNPPPEDDLMPDGAHPHAPAPASHVDIPQARECPECRGWGSLIRNGHYELCTACQTPDA